MGSAWGSTPAGRKQQSSSSATTSWSSSIGAGRTMPAGSLFGHWFLGGYQSPTLVNARRAQANAEGKRKLCWTPAPRSPTSEPGRCSASGREAQSRTALEQATDREQAIQRLLLLTKKGGPCEFVRQCGRGRRFHRPDHCHSR